MTSQMSLQKAEAMLSRGALLHILSNDDFKLNFQPVVEVLAYKRMADDPSNGGARYRFIMSDGDYAHQACMMIGSHFVSRIESGQFERNALIRLKKFTKTQTANGQTAILMEEVEALVPGTQVGAKLGKPQNTAPSMYINNRGGYNPIPIANESTPAKRSSATAFSPETHANGPTAKKLPKPDDARPIDSLNTFQNRNNVIMGRIVSKGSRRTWSNQRGDGELISFEIQDQTGKIRVTAFGTDLVQKVMNEVAEGKVYILTKCMVKTANKKFNPDADHEITLGDDAEIVPVSGDYGCPQIKYNFIRLSELENMSPDSNIDIAVVVRSIGTPSSVTSKKTAKELTKRDVRVVDESGTEVQLTLWNDEATNFRGTEGSVLLCRGVRISDYGGRTLSMGSGFSMLVDPGDDHTGVAANLRGWWEQNKSSEFRSLSNTETKRDQSLPKPILQLIEEADQPGVRLVWGTVDGYITRCLKFKKFDVCAGQSADGKPCGRKVTDMNNGYYRCDACGSDLNYCKKRVLQPFSVGDEVDSVIVTFFHDQVKELLGIHDDDELSQIFEDPRNVDEIETEHALMKRFSIRLKVGKEYYKEQERVKCTAYAVKPLNPIQRARDLLKMAQHFSRLDLNRE